MKPLAPRLANEPSGYEAAHHDDLPAGDDSRKLGHAPAGSDSAEWNAPRRILTGDRPTGRLHLGHWVGSLADRVRLQSDFACFFIIADLHTLTTRPHKEAIAELPENIREMVLDYLSLGIDPERATIFVQSAIPQTAELALICGMLISLPRLERVPSIKEMADAAHLDVLPFGLVGYPVLQAADILLPRADVVPVGRDNLPHVEVAREIARRFNHLYGDVFPEPQALVRDAPVLPGIHGREKMSKSLGNAILLSDSAADVERRVMQMYTDPARVRADIPGRVEGNPVFAYHRHFNPDRAEVAELEERYRKGQVGDVEVKRKLVRALNGFLEPIRERRAEFVRIPDLVDDILLVGNRRMRQEAEVTMTRVREAMGMTYFR